jgi:hypothetical protein
MGNLDSHELYIPKEESDTLPDQFMSQITTVSQAEKALKYTCRFNNTSLMERILQTYHKLINYFPILIETFQSKKYNLVLKMISFYTYNQVFHKACCLGEDDLVKYLLSHFTLSSIELNQGLSLSCIENRISTMDLLIHHGASNINQAISYSSSLEACKFLLDRKADPNKALLRACTLEDIPMIQLAIQYGATEYDKATMVSSRLGYLKAVAYLVQHIDNINLYEALLEAKHSQHYSVQLWLINRMKNTPDILKHVYTYPDDRDVIDFLIHNGVEKKLFQYINGLTDTDVLYDYERSETERSEEKGTDAERSEVDERSETERSETRRNGGEGTDERIECDVKKAKRLSFSAEILVIEDDGNEHIEDLEKERDETIEEFVQINKEDVE